MGEAVRIGVLGCSGFAMRRMLPAFAASPEVELVALASRDVTRAAAPAARYGCAAVDGYQALLERPDVEAVYLPLPAALHEHWAERALAAGKHVLGEKPLTTDAAATARLQDRARDRGLVLTENVLFVHHPQHEFAGHLAASGAIGDLKSFTAAFTVPRRPADDIRYVPELGGGALLDQGVYPVRAALHLLGGPLEVIGAVLEYGTGEVDTSGTALLRGPGGVAVQLAFGMDHEYRAAYELCGSHGRIEVDHAFTPPADRRPAVRLTRRGRVEQIELDPCDQVAAAVGAFADAVRTGVCPGAEALEQAQILDELRRASAVKTE